MTHGSHEAFAAFVGIAWADATPDVCLQTAGAATRAGFQLEHTPEAINAWGTTLRTRFNGQPVAIGLERHKGPSVSALRPYDFLVLFPINPLTLARYREACTPSRAKDDPPDAALQRALLRTHRDKRQPLQPQSPTRRARAPLVEHRLLVACGAQRARSASAADLQHYAGIAPVTERSGKKFWGHWRLPCPTLLRHTFVEWAAESMRPAFWAQVYSQPQRDQGKAHQAAVRALAFTWIRILSRCWQERTLYDESVDLQALHHRGSSLLHNLAKAS